MDRSPWKIFNNLKQKISSVPVLQNFNPKIPSVIGRYSVTLQNQGWDVVYYNMENQLVVPQEV